MYLVISLSTAMRLSAQKFYCFFFLDEIRRTLAVPTGFDVMYKDLQPNNEKQLKAIKQALTSRFTLIQGPPG